MARGLLSLTRHSPFSGDLSLTGKAHPPLARVAVLTRSQCFCYYNNFPKDRGFIKAYVVLVFTLTILQVGHAVASTVCGFAL
jgi:hypothetical protein